MIEADMPERFLEIYEALRQGEPANPLADHVHRTILAHVIFNALSLLQSLVWITDRDIQKHVYASAPMRKFAMTKAEEFGYVVKSTNRRGSSTQVVWEKGTRT